jgi:hypothetical protein
MFINIKHGQTQSCQSRTRSVTTVRCLAGRRLAKSVGGLAEPAGEVVVQVLLIVADPGDVAVGA